MSTYISNVPGYCLDDYLLILSPEEDLKDRITRIKGNFKLTYGSDSALAGKPHITLAAFRTWKMTEEKIVNRLKAIAMRCRPFIVDMKDFGSFPQHTIYINILSKTPIQKLSKELRSARRLMKSPDYNPLFITEPHLTIARRLNATQHHSAWLEYSHKQFTASFIADSMLLIKRPDGDKAYQIVKQLDFMDMPGNTAQGALFPA